MFQANNGRQVALGVLGLVLAGCSQGGLNQNDDQGIFLRSAIGNTCVDEGQTLTFDIAIVEVDAEGTVVENGYNDTITGVDLTQVFDAADLDLEADVDGNGELTPVTGIWVGGDQFITLAPGSYRVTATAVHTPGPGVQLLPSNVQTQTVTVPEGGTAETTFAFQCEGQTLSALDVVMIVSEGPSITGWEYDDDKFGMICEDVGMTATFSDINGGPLHITFEMYADPQTGYQGPGTGSGLVASQEFNANAPLGGGEISATWNYAHPGDAGTYYVYVTAENAAGASTTFQALFHAYEVVGEYCAVDSSWNTGAYSLVPTSSSTPAPLTYTPPGGTATNVEQAVLTIDNASWQEVRDVGDNPILVRILASSTAPVFGDDGRGLVGHQTLIYGGVNEVAFDVAFLSPVLSAGYELGWDPTDGRYEYSGTMQYALYDGTHATTARHATGRISGAWLEDDGSGGWTLHATQWRIDSNDTSLLQGDSRTPVVVAPATTAADLAMHARVARVDAFGDQGIIDPVSCDDHVDLNNECMAGLALADCELDCSEPPPPQAEACEAPIMPENVDANGQPIPTPAYPDECNISVNGDGYVQGYLTANSLIIGPQTWWCDSNNVLFDLSVVSLEATCAVGELTPACQDAQGHYGCAWQN